MRKYIYILLLLITTVSVNAQEKRLSLGLGTGKSFGQAEFKEWVDDGTSIYVDLMYNFNQRVSLGLEGNFSRFSPINTKINGALLKGLCNFQVTKFRSYGALMAGVFDNLFDVSEMDHWVYSTRFGAGVLFGIKYMNLNLDIAYFNLGRVNKYVYNFETTDENFVKDKVSFVQVRIGISFSFIKKKN